MSSDEERAKGANFGSGINDSSLISVADALDLVTLMSEPAQVLIQATLMERILEILLIGRMADSLSKKKRDKLFEGYGPLSTFSAKIDICHAFGLIDNSQATRLHHMRAVRNIFAHADSLLHFGHRDFKNNQKLKNNPYAESLAVYREAAHQLVEELRSELENSSIIQAIRASNARGRKDLERDTPEDGDRAHQQHDRADQQNT